MANINGNSSTPIAEPSADVRTKILPPFHVIIENDEFHSMIFVALVLRNVFSYDRIRCVELMLEAHSSGEAIVWTGSKEVAELKLEQILTYHEKRDDGLALGPLNCRIEPAR